MMTKIRYVFDTNIIISALLFANGKPAQALRHSFTSEQVKICCKKLAGMGHYFINISK